MEHGAVRSAATTEVVTLHDAMKTLALRLANHVDGGTRLEDADLHPIADVCLARVLELAQRTHRLLHDGPLEVPPKRTIDAAAGELLDQTDLHGVVAVRRGCLPLYDEARAGLNDRHRDERSVLGEHLGHSDLLANDSFDCHFRSPWNLDFRFVCGLQLQSS